MFDVGYVARFISLLWRLKKPSRIANIWAVSEVKGRCWTTDLDLNCHMNNARFLREADFGRFSLLIETGLWKSLIDRRVGGEKQTNVVVSAIQVQYRSSLQLGDRFFIRSRIDGWDDKAFFLQQQVILQQTNQVVCAFLVRLVLLPRILTPQSLVNDLYQHSVAPTSPTLSASMETFRLNYRLEKELIQSKL